MLNFRITQIYGIESSPISISRVFCYLTGLKLTISGKADFKWMNDRNGNIKAGEVYLKNTVFIFGNEDSDTVDIEAGSHSYKFSTTLPLEIPSSFVCEKYGKISYKAEAVFLLPWKMVCSKALARFKVISYVDLNFDPTLKLPFNSEITKNIKKMFFGSRSLHLKVFTPVTGFVGGHKIKLFFDINNRTKTNISKMKIFLVQVVKLISEEKTKTIRKVISETNGLGTQKKSSHQFESDITISTNVNPVKHSNVVNVSYQIEIYAKISSNSKRNPKFIIPIEIGTVPIISDRTSNKSGLSLAQSVSFLRNRFGKIL